MRYVNRFVPHQANGRVFNAVGSRSASRTSGSSRPSPTTAIPQLQRPTVAVGGPQRQSLSTGREIAACSGRCRLDWPGAGGRCLARYTCCWHPTLLCNKLYNKDPEKRNDFKAIIDQSKDALSAVSDG